MLYSFYSSIGQRYIICHNMIVCRVVSRHIHDRPLYSRSRATCAEKGPEVGEVNLILVL
ncbi:hypothetical protein HMPREF1989_02077 [Porphyromonas gingivalis F0566]|nr:hypothetical protein HMPREF1989_02077 [Porphyromonas gingivalis F0566]